MKNYKMFSTAEECSTQDNEIINRFQKAMKDLNKDIGLYDSGCFLPTNIVNAFIATAKFGNNEAKITALQLLGGYAVRNQIITLEPLQGVALFKKAAELNDKASATILKNYMNLLDESEKEALQSDSLLKFLDATDEQLSINSAVL